MIFFSFSFFIIEEITKMFYLEFFYGAERRKDPGSSLYSIWI